MIDRRMGKRGQITVFILIGIFIVILSGALLFVNRDRFSSVGVTGVQVEPIREFVRDCIDERMETLVPELRQFGGYSTLLYPFSSDQIEAPGVNILADNVVGSLSPQINRNVEGLIRQEILSYISGNCRPSDFRGGFDVELFRQIEPERDIGVLVSDENIRVDVDLPYILKKGDFEIRLGSISYQINDNFGRYYGIADQIISGSVNGDGLALALDRVRSANLFPIPGALHGDVITVNGVDEARNFMIIGIATEEESNQFIAGDSSLIPFRFAVRVET